MKRLYYFVIVCLTLSSSCSRPPHFSPRSQHIPVNEQVAKADLIFLGERSNSENLSVKATTPICGNPGQNSGNVELTLYRDTFRLQQVIKGEISSNTAEVFIFCPNEDLLPKAMRDELLYKRLWFLRLENSKLRPLTDLCVNSIELRDFPNNRMLVSPTDGASIGQRIAHGLLNPDNSKDWPSLPN